MRTNNKVNNEAYVKLINTLVQERKNQGLTMRALGERLGCVHTFVYKVENLQRNLSIQEFMQYTTALNLNYIDLLLEFEGNMNASRP